MQINRLLPKLELPYLCHGRFLLRLLVISQALSVVLAFSPGLVNDPWTRLGFISLFVHWLALLTTVILCTFRKWLNKLNSFSLLCCSLVIFEILTMLLSSVVYSWFDSYGLIRNQSLQTFTLANMMISFIIAVIAMQFFIIHTERNQQIRAQSQAELTALQARIEPHFLFNSLNTVAELTQCDANAAEQALLDLSALFRAALHAGKTVSLAEEFKLSKQYLSLEKWRLGNRMQIEWDTPSVIPELFLPALTIQPLLENAVRYGVEASKEKSVLKISVVESKKAVTLVITNPYVSGKSVKSGNGIALDNIRKRLQLHFGPEALLHSSIVDEHYRVKLVLPKQVSDI